MSLAITLHLLASVIWVGGMFFAYMALRPVAAQLLEAPMRLTLWAQVFERFFPYVWGSIIILLLTGLWITFSVLGGMGSAGMHVHTMLMLGIIMMLIFGHIYFAPFKRLKQAVETADWAMGGAKLGQIRMLIGINLCLGLLVVVIASMGRYW
ncbi:CopD family protein [Methylicorpusculum oleiharenae]|uniref:CopD family protein n=1 Tax=Methylicorpusculum oleiharenae TaxID=1338687 RepID=UPI00135C3A3B|nr:CopD family protein [Methylicorpusculum oleiharenae]MCD2450006.1 CopD family protein [Methylicorpusculum oleiharenae]